MSEWEKIKVKKGPDLNILKVQGGWMVHIVWRSNGSLSFVPDPDHKRKPLPVDIDPYRQQV